MFGIHDMADLTESWKDHDSRFDQRHTDPSHCSLFVKFLEKMIFKARLADAREEFVHASPVHHLKEHRADLIPPFFIGHGTYDSVVPVSDSDLFVEALRKLEIDAHFHRVEGGHHGFCALPGFQSGVFASLVEQWLWNLHRRDMDTN